MPDPGWERGDLLGCEFPVHLDALRSAGPEFLTGAFRAAGSMGADDHVTAIRQLEPFAGGSTGRKAVLSVTYDQPRPDLPEQLFVKFSRDLDDDLRDRGKRQMESEVRFGLLSHIPDFPVAVPRCLFGEYHAESGSGVLISERIAFGADGIEPHHPKARDHEIADLLAHYDTLITTLARLAGAHRAGRFPPEVVAHFEPVRTAARPSRRPPTTPEQVHGWIDRYEAFTLRCPQLLPASIRSDEFLDLMRTEAPRAVEHGAALRAAVQAGATDLFAFCHWNANIDNAWYWRDEHGALACGLMDWGNVGVMNMVTAISSALFFAEPDFLVEHLDHFFALFSTVFEESGGGPLDPTVLGRQFALQMVAGGLQWPLGTVPLLERHVPDLDTVADRFDPRIADDEFPRTQLHLLTSVLTLWRASDPTGVIDVVLAR